MNMIQNKLSVDDLLSTAKFLTLSVFGMTIEEAWDNIHQGFLIGTEIEPMLRKIREMLNLQNDDDPWPRQFEHKMSWYDNSLGVHWRPSIESIHMHYALDIAQRSTCLRKKVGSVIVSPDMNQVLAIGYNGSHRGGKNECDTPEAGNCGCIHSEQNSLLKTVANPEGAICFVSLSPCKMCAKILINRGISKVVYFEEYRDLSPVKLMQDAGLVVEKF